LPPGLSQLSHKLIGLHRTQADNLDIRRISTEQAAREAIAPDHYGEVVERGADG